jgi:hypothetical protein
MASQPDRRTLVSQDTHIVVDSTTGQTYEVPMTAQEITQRDADQQAAAAELAAQTARTQKLNGARPPAAIVQKLKDGTALSAPELQTVVRYLALQAIREAQG